MTAPRAFEAVSAARTPAEAVVELRPPRPLAEVVEGVLRPAAALRRDLRVPAGGLVVRDGRLIVGGEAFALRPSAAQQLRALVGLPARSPAHQLRRALAARREHDVFVRLDGREVRAVLGATFAPLDDLDVFTRIARAIDAMGWRDDLVARLVAMTDATTVLRLTLRRSRVEARPGDEFERGIEIANGECGRRALALTPIAFRLGCWNYSLGVPTLRLVHAGSLHRTVRDWRKDIATALDAARVLLDAWRATPHFAMANEITGAAKSRALRSRRCAEQFAQSVVERAS